MQSGQWFVWLLDSKTEISLSAVMYVFSTSAFSRGWGIKLKQTPLLLFYASLFRARLLCTLVIRIYLFDLFVSQCYVTICFCFKMDIARIHVPPVSGSKLRTASNVQLGRNELASRYYDTTFDDTYKPVAVPYFKADSHPKSIVPLKYYGKNSKINNVSRGPT